MPSSSAASDAAPYAPKYSLPERERRWLAVSALLPRIEGPGRLIEDRYLDGTHLRLRAVDGVWKLGKKYDGVSPSSRPIVNVYLNAAEYAVQAALPAAVLLKRRYDIEGFAVDCFAGALEELCMAEIERPSAQALAAVTPPSWFGR